MNKYTTRKIKTAGGLGTMGYISMTITAILLQFSCSLPDQKSQQANSPLPYLLAYNVLVEGDNDNYDIFTIDLAGENCRNITNHPDVAWTYLADGDKIFFISDRDTSPRSFFLYEMNVDGSAIRQITDFKLADSWMGIRNGSELVVTPHSSLGSALYIINLEGEILQKIKPADLYPSDPDFSPDGTKIAFIGKNKRSKRDPDFKAEIYSINVDGTALTQISQYPESDTTAEWYAYKAGPPRWHPTENFISFQSKQKGKYSLYAATPDGTRQWKLTDNNDNEGWHAWSADGKWLAIELFDTEENQFHIGLMNWSTKESRILTDTTYQYQQAPTFLIKG